MFYILYSSIMNNEIISITTLTGQGDTFPSRYSSPSAGKREGIMKHTQKQIEDQIETVEECLINLALLEVGDPVYLTILKALRMLDTRLDEADEDKEIMGTVQIQWKEYHNHKCHKISHTDES